MRHRFLAVLGVVVLLALGSHAHGASAIYYSQAANSYGWCAGYSYQRSHSCAKDECIKSNGTDCRPVVECDGGWGAVAFSDDPVVGFGATCGMSGAFTAQFVALSECVAASRTLCWTDAVFDANGNAQSKDADQWSDIVFYVQSMLQIRKYNVSTTDGTVGGETIAAVKQLQTDLGRSPTGTLDAELVERLFDAVGGGDVLADSLKRNILDPREDEIGLRGFSTVRSAPHATYSEQLMSGPKDRRLLALATMLATRQIKCALPAISAEPLGEASTETWSVECKEGTYTIILGHGNTVIIHNAAQGTQNGSPASGERSKQSLH